MPGEIRNDFPRRRGIRKEKKLCGFLCSHVSVWFNSAMFLFASVSFSQKDAHKIYDGNNAYYSGKVPDAALHYNKALEHNPNNKKANFNLGDALYKSAEMYRSGNLSLPVGANIRPDSMAKIIYGKAAENFAVVANSVSNKDTLHRAWHNIGNCYLQKCPVYCHCQENQ